MVKNSKNTSKIREKSQNLDLSLTIIFLNFIVGNSWFDFH